MNYSNVDYRTEELKFDKSNALKERFHSLIPGGSHTYAKGDDQFPENMAPYIVKGKGCVVWDVDGNEIIEYGMGLRAVTLGHAFDPINDAVKKELDNGLNFTRPAILELETAETFLDVVKADMVKFGKNGSDVTSAAVLLARAYTGRDMVAICGQHPFFSFDDWFMGVTPLNSGVPKSIQELTVKFNYNDLQSVEDLFNRYPDKIACVILEGEKETPPTNDFLKKLKSLCEKNGAIFILDEIINGFRLHLAGAQGLYDVEPHLSTFAKAMANGYSVAALAGKREIMELGSLHHKRDRVFLLSATYGAESGPLRASIATINYYRENPVIETLYAQGQKLKDGIEKITSSLGIQSHFEVMGKTSALIYSTKDQDRNPSQLFRTLFFQETVRRGLIAPSFIISYSHTDEFVNRTLDILNDALQVYKKALDEGIDKYLMGRSVKPVFRKRN
jgi:glutamate-1-semialdehyde 2,1-aminomutase